MFRYLLFPVLNALGSVLAAFAALMPWLFTRNALLDTHQRFCDDSTAFKSTSIQLL